MAKHIAVAALRVGRPRLKYGDESLETTNVIRTHCLKKKKIVGATQILQKKNDKFVSWEV